jgi:hypothetical protein
MEEKPHRDLSVEGPGSPISLRKWYENEHKDILKDTMVLIDSDGLGFEPDGLPCMEITPLTCRECTEYYVDNHFNGKQIPLYLLKPLYYMFFGSFDIYKETVTLSDIQKYFSEDEKGKQEYTEMLNKIKYSKRNPEAAQIIGFVIALCSGFNLAKKAGVPARFYIEHPESHMHPRRESRFMSMLDRIRKEYDQTYKEKDDDLE